MLGFDIVMLLNGTNSRGLLGNLKFCVE